MIPSWAPVSHKLSPSMTVNPIATCTKEVNSRFRKPNETATIRSGPVTGPSRNVRNVFVVSTAQCWFCSSSVSAKNRCLAARALVPCIWERILALFVMHCFVLFLLCFETVTSWHVSQLPTTLPVPDCLSSGWQHLQHKCSEKHPSSSKKERPGKNIEKLFRPDCITEWCLNTPSQRNHLHAVAAQP